MIQSLAKGELLRLFDFVVEIIVDHPVVGGSFGAFLAAIIAALVGQAVLAVVFVLVGVGLGVIQVLISNR